MKRIIFLTYVLLPLFSVPTAGADEIKIATGHTFIKSVFDPVRGVFKDNTGIDFKILFNDPVPALAALENGNADVAGASMTLDFWLEQAKKAGMPVKDADAYTSYVVASEKSMIVVNAGNKVKALTKEQLKGIFTGRVLNWKEVGGDDTPILVVWPSISSGALLVFTTRILDDEPITKTVYDVASMADTSDSIASTPEAIGIVTGNTAEKGLKEIAPAIERPLTLVFKGKPAPNLQKLLDFLKGEGKRFIK